MTRLSSRIASSWTYRAIVCDGEPLSGAMHVSAMPPPEASVSGACRAIASPWPGPPSSSIRFQDASEKPAVPAIVRLQATNVFSKLDRVDVELAVHEVLPRRQVE